jgi:glutamyl-tRNA reductase
MKPLPDESYEDWSKRVSMFETGHAMMQIANGKDIDKVLEEMSRRITDKLLHPIFKAIRESSTSTSNYNAEESKKQYRENYLDKNPTGVADHVIEDT